MQRDKTKQRQKANVN